jgi:hypothetical protein
MRMAVPAVRCEGRLATLWQTDPIRERKSDCGEQPVEQGNEGIEELIRRGNPIREAGP